jgi:3-phenylpropionate/cinnamic acid dioxygenase small subunit
MDAADLLAIQDLMAHYGHVVDDAAWDRLGEVFSPDAVFDLQALGLGAHRGTAEVRACFEGLDHPVAHHTTNVVIQAGRDGGARVRCKYLVVMPDGRTRSGEYRDEVGRGPDGWRLQRRTVVPRPADGPSPFG